MSAHIITDNSSISYIQNIIVDQSCITFWETLPDNYNQRMLMSKNITENSEPVDLTQLLKLSNDDYIINIEYYPQGYYLFTIGNDISTSFQVVDKQFKRIKSQSEPDLPDCHFEYSTLLFENKTWFSRTQNMSIVICTVWSENETIRIHWDGEMYSTFSETNGQLFDIVRFPNSSSLAFMYVDNSDPNQVRMLHYNIDSKESSNYSLHFQHPIENIHVSIFSEDTGLRFYGDVEYYNYSLHQSVHSCFSFLFDPTVSTYHTGKSYQTGHIHMYLNDINSDKNQYIYIQDSDTPVYRLHYTYNPNQIASTSNPFLHSITDFFSNIWFTFYQFILRYSWLESMFKCYNQYEIVNALTGRPLEIDNFNQNVYDVSIQRIQDVLYITFLTDEGLVYLQTNL